MLPQIPVPQPHPRTPSLTSIANRYGTDKGTIGPSSVWGAHNYTDVYEAYLHPLRNRPVNLLEIGLGVVGDRQKVLIAHGRNADGGASIRMWRDYFAQGRIFGIDVNPAKHLDDDRVRTAVVDQGDRGELEAFISSINGMTFDVIVDDGSHRPDDQQVSLSALFPRLRPGGLYFIEDLMDNGRGDPQHGGPSVPKALNTRAVLRSFADGEDFAQPNALFESAELAAGIASVHFHAPAPEVHPESRAGRETHWVVRYREDEERLCALRKVSERRNASASTRRP